MKVIGLMVSGGALSAGRAGQQVVSLQPILGEATAGEVGQPARVALRVEASDGKTRKAVWAAGLVEATWSQLEAEVVLPSGSYRVSCAEGPPGDWRFALRGDGTPPVLFCRHEGPAPSTYQTQFIGGNPQTSNIQVVQLASCCRAEPAAWKKIHNYSLSVFVVEGRPVRVEGAGRGWTLRHGEYLVSSPEEAIVPASRQRWPIRFRRITADQALLRALRERLGLPKALGPFRFHPGPRPVQGALAQVLALCAIRPVQSGVWQTAFHEQSVELLVLALLAEHPNALWGFARSRGARALDPRLQQALAYVAVQCARPGLDLGQVAAAVGVGAEWLRKRFVAEVGQPMREYLQAVRVKRAQELLRSRASTVEQVALAVGYRDVRAFRRAYRRHTQGSPRHG